MLERYADDAKIVADSQSLMSLMNLPDGAGFGLIDIGCIEPLWHWKDGVIGALEDARDGSEAI